MFKIGLEESCLGNLDHFCRGATISLDRSQTGFTWEQTVGQKLLQSAKQLPQRGDGGEGGVSGQRHQLAGAGLHGHKQQPNPAMLRNRWWEPKVVSSNYYARVHSNRPPLCRSLQERSSPALRQHQANQQERKFVSFPALRSEQKLFCLFKKKSLPGCT